MTRFTTLPFFVFFEYRLHLLLPFIWSHGLTRFTTLSFFSSFLNIAEVASPLPFHMASWVILYIKKVGFS
jgi:hypothetical protein